MRFSPDTITALEKALDYATKEKLEYVTPELVLLMLLDNPLFCNAYGDCGGDLRALASNLTAYIEQYVDKTKSEPAVSYATDKLLNLAEDSSVRASCDEIGLRHLIHSFWLLDDSYALYYMQEQGIEERELLERLSVLEENETVVYETAAEYVIGHDKQSIREFAPCLNDTLKNVNPLIGREEELERTIQVLCRRDKNNPIHIGESGVGKTAVTYGLVQRLQKGDVPDALKDAKVYSLDLGSILAGTQYRGDFEKRLKRLLKEIGKEKSPIIYIDEIHNLAGAGAVGESSFDASNMLKPYLAEGNIRFIGATTFEEYKKHFEKNKSLVRRFQQIQINEPGEKECVEILKGLKPGYEKFHGVKYGKGVVEYIVEMSSKLIHERFLPDKAIDILDEAGAYRKLHPLSQKTQSVNKDVVDAILTKICQVPVESLKTENVGALATLESRLESKVFGQEEAISQVVNAVKFSKAGLSNEGMPLASLLFVGPTGVGKTEIARSLADELGIKLIRFDMSEYGEKHAVAKLIGSPAGYVGYEDGGLLTEAIRKNPSAVLLLDEIEKAHSDIFNILLQVMDYATLTDNQGRRADFRNVILIMTSNAGASKLGKKGIGFESGTLDSSLIKDAITKVFKPEFRNRLNKIVVFNSMNDAMAEQIVYKKLNELSMALAAKKIELIVDDNARALVKAKGISQEFGAREIDRVIRNEIKPLFVDEILFGKLKNGGRINIGANNNCFNIVVSEKKMQEK